MYLGAKPGPRFAFDPFNTEENETLAVLWEEAWLIALFTPFLLVAAYFVTTFI